MPSFDEMQRRALAAQVAAERHALLAQAAAERDALLADIEARALVVMRRLRRTRVAMIALGSVYGVTLAWQVAALAFKITGPPFVLSVGAPVACLMLVTVITTPRIMPRQGPLSLGDRLVLWGLGLVWGLDVFAVVAEIGGAHTSPAGRYTACAVAAVCVLFWVVVAAIVIGRRLRQRG